MVHMRVGPRDDVTMHAMEKDEGEAGKGRNWDETHLCTQARRRDQHLI